MGRKFLTLIVAAALCAALALAGCSSSSSSSSNNASSENGSSSTEVQSDTTDGISLEDGTYTATFNTDSSMFHVNETKDGKGTLTVKDGKATIHVLLGSVHIVKLYYGTAEEAKQNEADAIGYTEEKVTYDDGYEETAYAFDIPVPAIGVDYNVAILGTKGTWYDHTVSVENPTLEQ